MGCRLDADSRASSKRYDPRERRARTAVRLGATLRTARFGAGVFAAGALCGAAAAFGWAFAWDFGVASRVAFALPFDLAGSGFAAAAFAGGALADG